MLKMNFAPFSHVPCFVRLVPRWAHANSANRQCPSFMGPEVTLMSYVLIKTKFEIMFRAKIDF